MTGHVSLDGPADGRDFHHPFTPYSVQVQFMESVWKCCERGSIGIFESPTGTGKSLSLICASLSWLRDFKRRSIEGEDDSSVVEADVPQWMLEHSKNQKRQIALQRIAELDARLAKIRAREDRVKERYEGGEASRKRQRVHDEEDRATEDDQFLLDHYESDDEQKREPTTAADGMSLTAETRALLDKLKARTHDGDCGDTPDLEDETKIIYCSRTHSQLRQFASELRRVKMPPTLAADEKDAVAATHEPFKSITLGSRKNLCINPKVLALRNNTMINERCLEIQQPSTSMEQKCPYVPQKANEALVNDFRDHALAKVRDIEDLGAIGKAIGICPYYASRNAINPTEIVSLPYPLLLQRQAREALGLSVKGHVVIIDEAHNLMDSISAIHSVSVNLTQLRQCRAQLGGYLQKFRTKLKGKNRVYLAQLVRLIDSLTEYLQAKINSNARNDDEALMAEFLAGKGVDQINLHKLSQYVQESKLARKVEGYTTHVQTKNDPAGAAKVLQKEHTTPTLMQVQSFLLCLVNPTNEGRFFYSRSSELVSEASIKYMLLDPTAHFAEIVSSARAVILAGGTMSPMSDYTSNLFRQVPAERISTLSCGHVIPSSHLLVIPVPKADEGLVFDFTYSRRHNTSVIDELGRTLWRASKIIPDGVVVFFPSYDFLDFVIQRWRSVESSLWEDLSKLKRIFTEPRSGKRAGSTDDRRVQTVEEVLSEYHAHIHSSTREDNGALMLAVIGGSLSEGINFSDRLGRGVAVVGLPFPNAHSAEWKAKMDFVSQREGARGKEGAQDFYENACMRAVNQSIGRAIRHQKDYAAILLLDARFGSTRIKSKLPAWIQSSMITGASDAQDLEKRLSRFFKERDEEARRLL